MPKTTVMNSEVTCYTLSYTMISQYLIQGDIAPSCNTDNPVLHSITRKCLVLVTG